MGESKDGYDFRKDESNKGGFYYSISIITADTNLNYRFTHGNDLVYR